MKCASIPPYFLEQCFDLSAPFGEIGRAKRFISAVGKEEVGHFQIALRTMQRRGFRVDFLTEPVGRFSYQVAGTNIADNGGINRVSMDHSTVVPYPWLELRVHTVHKKSRQHHIGICHSQEETGCFELMHFVLSRAHRIAQCLNPRSTQMFGLGELCLQRAQPRLSARQEWTYQFGLFGPPIGCHRLKGGIARIHSGQAVGVRAVGIHIHVCLEQNGSAFGLRMPQFKDRFAVEEIMAGQQLVEPGQTPLQLSQFAAVKRLIFLGNPCRLDHASQSRQNRGQGGIKL